MVGVPGEPVDPEDFANPVFETIELDPAESGAALAVQFNHGYAIYADNAGSGGNNTRIWFEGPDQGEFVIGPRAGGSNFGSIRLRTSATTASAATCNIDTNGVIRRSISSRKYKTDIQDHEMDLDALRRLRVVTFLDRGEVAEREAWRERMESGHDPEPEPPVRRYVGLVAEEVDELGLGELVQYGPDGEVESLMYDRITLGLLQLVGGLEDRLKRAEQRLASLEG